MDIKEKSYLYGLFITDGSLYLQSRDRGRISLEINEKDIDLLEKIKSIVPEGHITHRERDTDFKLGYRSATYTNYQKEFRDSFIEMGFPVENKTLTASIPSQEYSERDFWRGVIDGDGSLGFTAEGDPFMSLVTKSEKLKIDFCSYLQKELNIIKHINKNKRDSVYNITIKNEDAVQLAKILYDRNDTLFLNRKIEKKEQMEKWVRIKKKANRRAWTEEEDKFILAHSVAESMINLNRTESSIRNRLRRLKSQK